MFNNINDTYLLFLDGNQTSFVIGSDLNLQTRHKIVQSEISRLNKSWLFVFCNVHYFLTRLSYHLRSCLNQSLLSFLFYYTSEWVRSTSLTRQSFWFVFIHVEIKRNNRLIIFDP